MNEESMINFQLTNYMDGKKNEVDAQPNYTSDEETQPLPSKIEKHNHHHKKSDTNLVQIKTRANQNVKTKKSVNAS